MGSKLTAIAAVIVASSLASVAHAEDPKDLFKRGVDLYKQAKYDESAKLLKKSYDLDPNPNTLFALAQSERLQGECKLAVEHYKKVIEQVNDLNVAKLVQQNLSLCEKQEPAAEPAHVDDKPHTTEPAPPPQIVTKTVTRDTGSTDKLAMTAAAFGALALGASGGLYIAASANRDAADKARTLDDHNALSDKASTQQKETYVVGGLGVALVGLAVYRWVTAGSGESSTAVAVVPAANGGSVSYFVRF